MNIMKIKKRNLCLLVSQSIIVEVSQDGYMYVKGSAPRTLPHILFPNKVFEEKKELLKTLDIKKDLVLFLRLIIC
ncbi:hypothetical protein KH172YL63_02800 [Bacillus sp. KH172YL63]|nr:hypothetical protein KH172YL63_02800 [Bacillus sp. KH172YL63]